MHVVYSIFIILLHDTMRIIKTIHRAVVSPVDDLITYRAMPTETIDHLDPFLFLNHHGPQVYPPMNQGLPFGPHPHRGFETLTFIFDGDLMHLDSCGVKSIIKAGGIQWMTAGRGIVHAEVSSDEFKKKGGNVELIQLWFNLPARLKMIKSDYIGLQKDEIPAVSLSSNKVRLNVVSGTWNNVKGAVRPQTGIEIVSMELDRKIKYETTIEKERNILLYVVRGNIEVNGRTASRHDLIEFGHNAERIEISALEDSLILFGHGMPYNEPIVAQGPFVMNNIAEIKQAWLDYQAGKMGSWEMNN